MTRTRPITIDDEVVSLARRFRKEALAALVAVLRDENAPASARAQASAKLLEYSDGKPSQARQLTVADVSAMTPSLRQELLHALLVHYQTEMPAQFKAMLKASVDEALRLQAALPKPPLTDPAKVTKFKRGPLAGKGPEVPRWPPHPPTLTPRSDAIRRDSCGEPRASPAQPPADPESALYAPLIVSHEGAAQRGSGERPEPPPARRQASESPDNVVVQLPGTARACTPRSSCAQRRKIPGEGDDQATTDPRPVP